MPRILEFGMYKDRPLDSVPTPYLCRILTFPNIRRHPDFIADVFGVLTGRLLADPDAVVREFLEPPPADAIANAREKRAEAKRAMLAKLLARRERDEKALQSMRNSAIEHLRRTPGGVAILKKRGLL